MSAERGSYEAIAAQQNSATTMLITTALQSSTNTYLNVSFLGDFVCLSFSLLNYLSKNLLDLVGFCTRNANISRLIRYKT